MSIVKREIAGLIGGGLSLLIVILTTWFSWKGNITELAPLQLTMRILSMLSICTAAGFSGYIEWSKKGFILYFGAVALFTLLATVTMITTSNLPQYLYFIYITCCVVITIALNVSANMYNNIRAQLEEDTDSKTTPEEEQVKKLIGYPHKSIIVTDKKAFYQIVKQENGYLFHLLCSIDEELPTEKFLATNNPTNYTLNQGDYLIAHNEIKGVKVTLKNAPSQLYCGTIKINIGGECKKYNLPDLLSEHQLKSFFVNVDIANKTATQPKHNLSQKDRRALKNLNNALLVKGITSTIVLTLLCFVSTVTFNAVLTAMSIAVLLVPFVLYIKFPQYISMANSSRSQPYMTDGKINVLLSAFLPLMFIAFQIVLQSFNCIHFDWARFAVISAGVFVLLFAILLITTSEYRKNKKMLVVMALALLLLSCFVVYNLNANFIYGTTQTVQCEITEMHTNTTGVTDETDYYMQINYNGTTISLQVDKQTYQSQTVGQTIDFYVKKGLLGIESVFYNRNTEQESKATELNVGCLFKLNLQTPVHYRCKQPHKQVNVTTDKLVNPIAN